MRVKIIKIHRLFYSKIHFLYCSIFKKWEKRRLEPMTSWSVAYALPMALQSSILHIADIYLLVYERIPELSSWISLSQSLTFIAVHNWFSMERAKLTLQVLLVSVSHRIGGNGKLLRESTNADRKRLKIPFSIANCRFRLPDCNLKRCFNAYRSALLDSRDSSRLLPIRCEYTKLGTTTLFFRQKKKTNKNKQKKTTTKKKQKQKKTQSYSTPFYLKKCCVDLVFYLHDSSWPRLQKVSCKAVCISFCSFSVCFCRIPVELQNGL